MLGRRRPRLIWRGQERVVAGVLPVALRVQPVGDLS
jgi:hypothetical protein